MASEDGKVALFLIASFALLVVGAAHYSSAFPNGTCDISGDSLIVNETGAHFSSDTVMNCSNGYIGKYPYR